MGMSVGMLRWSPLFQAEVSEWTSVVSRVILNGWSTRLWPLECENHNTVVAMDQLEREDPVLIAWVRKFHLDGLLKKKRDLRIWSSLTLYLQAKCFWDNKHKYFPRKTKGRIGSYYFNAYLVRRSYQNRVTPKKIDSDDEAEFGSLSDGYGHEALMVPGCLLC
ncbi:AT-RICH INTERACTIVE DOMAIN-CONTAINING PROTEIN 2 [Salix purpurea]|uniref:AT-RICH INTERACTIVE DOMAIN-CONTAINING PROTEIN 2 n=1 Tax=Salix purpurea TaxID=77065 RepID=A0A9Q0YWC3_SALPP|nr:AT-RICH INTERACTIVE DOMAIN-CONTAINING PROTEIN 2 [Salix purpurea]